MVVWIWGWYDLVVTTDSGEDMFNVPTLVSVIEDYISEHNIHIYTEDSNVQMCCVLFANNISWSSKVLLVLDNSCETEKAIDAIAEKIWEHEDYGDPEEYDDGSYNKAEIRSAASKLSFRNCDCFCKFRN